MDNQNTAGVDLDKLLIQAEATAILGSEKHCRDLLLEFAKCTQQAAPEAPAGNLIAENERLRAALRRIENEPADGEPWVIASEALTAPAAQQAGAAVQTQHDAWGVYHKPTGKWVQDHDGRVQLLSEQNARNICISEEYEACHLRVDIRLASPAATTASASQPACAYCVTPGVVYTDENAPQPCPYCRAPAPSRDAAPAGPALREMTLAIIQRLGWTINGTFVITKSGDELHAADAIAFVHAALAQQGASHASNAGEDTGLPRLSWLDAPSDIANEHAHAWATGWNAARLAAIAASAKEKK